jgi:hypothetical protein
MNRNWTRTVGVLIAAVAFCAGAAPAQAAFYTESGDAGVLHTTAQNTSGSGTFEGINGQLSSFGDVDVFRIYINNASAFQATTVGVTALDIDTQLFLFDANGRGVRANDDSVGLQSTINQGSGLSPAITTGYYYIAISSFNNDPRDASNNLIFPTSPFGNQFGPNNPNAVLDHWDGTGGSSGAYTIAITGADFAGAAPAVPAPPGVVLFAIGLIGLGGFRLLRRKAAVAVA